MFNPETAEGVELIGFQMFLAEEDERIQCPFANTCPEAHEGCLEYERGE